MNRRTALLGAAALATFPFPSIAVEEPSYRRIAEIVLVRHDKLRLGDYVMIENGEQCPDYTRRCRSGIYECVHAAAWVQDGATAQVLNWKATVDSASLFPVTHSFNVGTCSWSL